MCVWKKSVKKEFQILFLFKRNIRSEKDTDNLFFINYAAK